jgi:hypothetical protein
MFFPLRKGTYFTTVENVSLKNVLCPNFMVWKADTNSKIYPEFVLL